MFDLSDDHPEWREMARLNCLEQRTGGRAVVIQKKIYCLGGQDTSVEVYDEIEGILMKYFQSIISSIYRSVDNCYQHANYEIPSRCSCT